MTTNETLLGFDARTPSDARRNQYLLRHTHTPLSVDNLVWPSLSNEWNGAIQGQWDNLAALQRSLKAQTFTTVAVTLLTRGAPSEHEPMKATVTPATRDESWRLLGYDIADAWLISGLSNCGYRPDEVAALRTSWADALNEHHLFTNLDRAFEFRAAADQRVREHAPFFGLYVIAS